MKSAIIGGAASVAPTKGAAAASVAPASVMPKTARVTLMQSELKAVHPSLVSKQGGASEYPDLKTAKPDVQSVQQSEAPEAKGAAAASILPGKSKMVGVQRSVHQPKEVRSFYPDGGGKGVQSVAVGEMPINVGVGGARIAKTGTAHKSMAEFDTEGSMALPKGYKAPNMKVEGLGLGLAGDKTIFKDVRVSKDRSKSKGKSSSPSFDRGGGRRGGRGGGGRYGGPGFPPRPMNLEELKKSKAEQECKRKVYIGAFVCCAVVVLAAIVATVLIVWLGKGGGATTTSAMSTIKSTIKFTTATPTIARTTTAAKTTRPKPPPTTTPATTTTTTATTSATATTVTRL